MGYWEISVKVKDLTVLIFVKLRETFFITIKCVVNGKNTMASWKGQVSPKDFLCKIKSTETLHVYNDKLQQSLPYEV